MNAIPMLIVVLLVLLFIGWSLRQPFQQIQRLRRAVRGPIGTLPMTGLVGIAGQASGQELRSPLTDTPCILWQIEVERYRNKRWRRVYKKTSTQPITLDDATGQVQVWPQDADLLLSDDLRQSRGWMSRINPEIELKLESLGVETGKLWGNFGSQLRVFERYITSGENFSALGLIGYPDGRPSLQARPEAPLFLTDRPLEAALRGFYWRVATTAGMMGLIVAGFSCCVLLQTLEPR